MMIRGKRQKQIMALLEKNELMSIRELAFDLSVPDKEIWRVLKLLHKRGIVGRKRIIEPKFGISYKYFRSEQYKRNNDISCLGCGSIEVITIFQPPTFIERPFSDIIPIKRVSSLCNCCGQSVDITDGKIIDEALRESNLSTISNCLEYLKDNHHKLNFIEADNGIRQGSIKRLRNKNDDFGAIFLRRICVELEQKRVRNR